MSEEFKEDLVKDPGSGMDKMSRAEEDPGFPEGDVGEKMLIRMNDHHKALRDWGFSFINWIPGMEILDVGCGGGAAIHEMLELSEGSIVKGIDYSDTSIRLSEELNAQAIEYERCSIKKYDVMDMPYIDNAYDLVTAVETVYFWKDPEIAFRHINRVLKPGGMFAVLAEASVPSEDDDTKYDTPMTIYTPEELTDIMKRTGFENMESHRGENENIMVTGVKKSE